MWSIATEAQIYIVFALALLPLWRTAGGVVTVIVAWIVGSLPFYLLPPDANFFWACPWFIGSFAFGMAGAVIGFGKDRWSMALRTVFPWGICVLAGFGMVAAMCALGWADTWGYPVVDLVVSALAISCINWCVARTAKGDANHPVLKVLGSAPLVYLAGFSYSLYLIQHPVLRLTEKVANGLPLSYDANIVAQLLVATPTVMAVAWLFSEFFERPFTSGAVLLPKLRRLAGIE
jgi:peptidoglycan/LPS O-acetylase OafA/YrhL